MRRYFDYSRGILRFLAPWGRYVTPMCVNYGVDESNKSRFFYAKSDNFTAGRYAGAVYAVIVHLSVRPSVCLSQVGVLQRWLR